MSNNTKATVEEEEDAATVGGYHGYPVLMKTDMSEEMASEVGDFDQWDIWSSVLIQYLFICQLILYFICYFLPKLNVYKTKK